MKSKLKTHWRRNEGYIVGLCAAIVLVCLAYAGHYIYTGKGWLVLTGKESVADFYYNRGLYYFGGGAYNLPKAQESFQQALAHTDGRYPMAYYQLGRIYFVIGDFSAALAETEAELAQYPDHYRTHYVRGLIYGYRKQFIQAEAEFKAFIQKEPYPTWAGYNDLAWVYFSQGKYADAAETARKGLDAKPQAPYSAWLENSLGVSEMNLGNWWNAEYYLSLSLKHFQQMTEEQWGIAYPGNDPEQYDGGLAQTRAAIQQNLSLVHSKLGDE